MALHEGAALLGQSPELAALEMAGMGGTFEATQNMRIALTGARMQASIDDSLVAGMPRITSNPDNGWSSVRFCKAITAIFIWEAVSIQRFFLDLDPRT